MAITTREYLSNSYDTELNEKRVEYGLFPITKNWKLDSIESIGYTRRLGCDPSENFIRYGILENKWYCQYWTNKNTDRTKAYLESKQIYYTKSFWIWQNEFDMEFNTYVNPITDNTDNLVLQTMSYFKNDYPFIRANLAYVKSGEDILNYKINDKMVENTERKVDSILKEWKIK